jgi:hypothetical protein
VLSLCHTDLPPFGSARGFASLAKLRLSRHPADRRDQFLNLVPLVSDVAGGERGGDTVRYVIAKDLLLHFVQSSANGVNLRQYVHAVAIVLDHPKQTANLTLDTPEAFGDFHFGRIVHGSQSLIPYP